MKNLIPVLPSRNLVIFPGRSIPISVRRAKSVGAIDAALAEDKRIIVLAQKTEVEGKEPKISELFHTGTLAKIEKTRGNAKDGFELVVRGLQRIQVSNLEMKDGIIYGSGDVVDDVEDADEKTQTALIESIKTLGKEILELVPADTRQLQELINSIDDLAFLTYLCGENLDIPVARKQELLETLHVKRRSLLLLELMQTQKEALLLQHQIRDKLSRKLGKSQRESILREQLKAIREELGETSEGAGNEDYRTRIESAGMPEDVKKVANEEAKRLEAIGNSSPESHVIRNYLDLLCSLPWNKSASEDIDLEKARQVLESEHYGLEKVKQRIIQHLAVMKLKKSGRGSILLLVGPPGVGKTSLGESIARTLGRKFVRGSLGGVRDDAEIRGHRRTYIGAMPGRVVQGIKRAGENNPVFMLDEIDKLARGFSGDPSSALLEVLDPEQNATFLDHYLDVPFDLSKVFFIATANSLEPIPEPLLDRMEVIDLSGYTLAEKLHIAKNHLIPKQLEEHGITAGQLAISDEALMRIITHYTREAGVRELQRRIAAVCRASTEKILANTSSQPVRVESAHLDEILGPERFVHEVAERIMSPGVATGLAWTPQGGEILFIEASLMPGNGKLTLTGQLGEVMKESAHIAMSLVRSRLPSLVPGFEYDKKDIHVHVPAGAIPKDGPSAGITMLTTLASLFSGRSVSPTLAMTGEITLRGAVMPVGGIKEKVIAAHRAGIERVIMSARNQKDLRDVPEEVRSKLKFEFVETAEEVLSLALGLQAETPKINSVLPPSANDSVAGGL